MREKDTHPRVGFDARWSGDSGVGTYVGELLEELKQVAASGRYALIVYQSPGAESRHIAGVEYRSICGGKYSLLAQFELGARCIVDRLDLLHVPFYVIPMLAKCPVVATIHDIEPLLFAYAAPSGWGRYAVRSMYKLTARRCRTLIAVSHHTKEDIVNQLGVGRAKISVIHEAASGSFEMQEGDEQQGIRECQALQVNGPFLLAMLGKQGELKNTSRILSAYRLYREKGGTAELVLVGDTRFARDWLPQLDNDGTRSHVRVIGRVSIDTLRRLYHRCTAFVFPSIYEGFGLPILEALRAGTLVITSNTASMPEVAGDVTFLVDPKSVTGLAAQMSLACSITYRERAARISAGHAHALTFSWPRAARETSEVYETVFRGRERSLEESSPAEQSAERRG